jgi:hypothetical protein
LTAGNIYTEIITGNSGSFNYLSANTLTAGNIYTEIITGNSGSFNYLSANTLTAGNIYTNTVTGNSGSFNYLSANTLTAGNIYTNTLSGSSGSFNYVIASSIICPGSISYTNLNSNSLNLFTTNNTYTNPDIGRVSSTVGVNNTDMLNNSTPHECIMYNTKIQSEWLSGIATVVVDYPVLVGFYPNNSSATPLPFNVNGTYFWAITTSYNGSWRPYNTYTNIISTPINIGQNQSGSATINQWNINNVYTLIPPFTSSGLQIPSNTDNYLCLIFRGYYSDYNGNGGANNANNYGTSASTTFKSDSGSKIKITIINTTKSTVSIDGYTGNINSQGNLYINGNPSNGNGNIYSSGTIYCNNLTGGTASFNYLTAGTASFNYLSANTLTAGNIHTEIITGNSGSFRYITPVNGNIMTFTSGTLEFNTAFPLKVGAGNSQGNTFITSNSASSNSLTTGQDNVGLGKQTLALITSGSSNTAIGTYACNKLTGGTCNVAIGYDALKSGDFSYNVGIGHSSSSSLTSGISNTTIGYQAGFNIKYGSYNTFIGSNTSFDNTNSQYDYSTAIGHNTLVTGSRQIVLGTSKETVYIPGTLGFISKGSFGYLTADTLTAGNIYTNIITGSSGSFKYLTGGTSNFNYLQIKDNSTLGIDMNQSRIMTYDNSKPKPVTGVIYCDSGNIQTTGSLVSTMGDNNGASGVSGAYTQMNNTSISLYTTGSSSSLLSINMTTNGDMFFNDTTPSNASYGKSSCAIKMGNERAINISNTKLNQTNDPITTLTLFGDNNGSGQIVVKDSQGNTAITIDGDTQNIKLQTTVLSQQTKTEINCSAVNMTSSKGYTAVELLDTYDYGQLYLRNGRGTDNNILLDGYVGSANFLNNYVKINSDGDGNNYLRFYSKKGKIMMYQNDSSASPDIPLLTIDSCANCGLIQLYNNINTTPTITLNGAESAIYTNVIRPLSDADDIAIGPPFPTTSKFFIKYSPNAGIMKFYNRNTVNNTYLETVHINTSTNGSTTANLGGSINLFNGSGTDMIDLNGNDGTIELNAIQPKYNNTVSIGNPRGNSYGTTSLFPRVDYINTTGTMTFYNKDGVQTIVIDGNSGNIYGATFISTIPLQTYSFNNPQISMPFPSYDGTSIPDYSTLDLTTSCSIPSGKTVISLNTSTINITFNWTTENLTPLPVELSVSVFLYQTYNTLPYSLSQGYIFSVTDVPPAAFPLVGNITTPGIMAANTNSGSISIVTSYLSNVVSSGYNIHTFLWIYPTIAPYTAGGPNIIIPNNSINISPNILTVNFT